MSWHWHVLTGIVRFLFIFAPFLKVEREFNLQGDHLNEAREFAQAGSCKAMVVSSPAFFLLRMLQTADTQCKNGTDPFMVTVYVVGLFVVAFLGFKIPAWLYRGTVAPYVWLLCLTALEVLIQAYFQGGAVKTICRP